MRLRQKPNGRTKRGSIKGYLFTPLLIRRALISFESMVPRNEGYKNPQYLKIEAAFAKTVEPEDVHDCMVSVGKDRFLVTAYWAGTEDPNPAVEMVCGGLEWRGEIAVVQVGRVVTFYKRVRRTTAVKKVVAKFVTEFMRCMVVGDPFPTSLVAG
ncbi:hypothetical protein BJ322DRAFT_1018105 [Thelephora terrestris]|uniref:Uncharacterized protein n=1 Tax=Thelephora terrestris TaxID=56493 RepID=A0A9P6HKK5_9AGAM|nr:hypothetical protein BJ322DRAFT_1114269 [Thelephora terrestris]KAF9789461.1 hypothetical protein BJ322DRAFT_1018105 [Thelephora terrestris]